MYNQLALAMAFVAGVTAAAQAEPWGVSGDWSVFVDPTTGNGCFARKVFEEELTVEFGAEPDRDGGFFAAYNPAWATIEDGATGTITFDFGDAKFAGDAVGAIRDGVPGGRAFFDNPAFVEEFGKRVSVIVTGESGTEVEVSLDGSAKAIETVLACQAEQTAE